MRAYIAYIFTTLTILCLFSIQLSAAPMPVEARTTFEVRPITRHHLGVYNYTALSVTVELTGMDPFDLAGGERRVILRKDLHRTTLMHITYDETRAREYEEKGRAQLRSIVGNEIMDVILADAFWSAGKNFGVMMPESDLEMAEAVIEMLQERNEAQARMQRLIEPIKGNKKEAEALWVSLVDNFYLLNVAQGNLSPMSYWGAYERTTYSGGKKAGKARNFYKDGSGGQRVTSALSLEFAEHRSTTLTGIGGSNNVDLSYRLNLAILPELRLNDNLYIRPMVGISGTSQVVTLEGEGLSIEQNGFVDEETTTYVLNGEGCYDLIYEDASIDLIVRASFRPRYFVEGGVGVFLGQSLKVMSSGSCTASEDNSPQYDFVLTDGSTTDDPIPYFILRGGILFGGEPGQYSHLGGYSLTATLRFHHWENEYGYRLLDGSGQVLGPQASTAAADFALSIGFSY